MQLTTLSPPAIIGDAVLWWLLWLGTADWEAGSAQGIFWSLLAWMIFSKFIKLITHFARYPVDIFLWPVSVLFGWFHGGIKMYALATLSEVSHRHSVDLSSTTANDHVQTTWGSRDGADADDKDRMIKQIRPQYEYYDEKLDEKLPLHEPIHDSGLYDIRPTTATAA